MKETKLLNCPFCGENIIYKTKREDEFEIIIPQLFCNSCKMTFEIENDSPYLNDGKTYDYLEEKLYKTFNTRKPMERIIERLEERKDGYVYQYSLTLDPRSRCCYESYDDAIDIVKEEGEINV